MDLGVLVDDAALDPGAGHSGQVLLERAEGLLHQLAAVGEKQHPLDALLPLEQLDQGDGNAGLAGAGGENE